MKRDNLRDHKWHAKRPMERCICLILFVSILLSLLSCSSADKISLHTDATVIPYAHAQKLDWTGAFSSADTASQIVGATLVGDQIVVLLRTENEYTFAIFNEKGEKIGFSSNYPLSETEGIYGIYSNQKDELLLVTGEYAIDPDGQTITYKNLSVTAFDSSGKTLGVRCRIEKDFQEVEPTVEIDASGNLYVKTGNTISSYGTDGKLQFANKYGDLSGLYVIGDTPIAARGCMNLYPVSADGSNSAVAKNLQGGSSLIFEGCRDGLFAYNSAGVYAYNFDKMQMDSVLLWNNTDLKSKNDSKIIRILSKEIMLAETGTDQGITELYLLLASSKPPIEKQVVTLAGIGIGEKPYIKTLVEKFNEQSDKYELQIRDYLSDGEMNLEDAKKRMNLDILSNNTADLYLYFDNEFQDPDDNVFVDLNTFINSDPSFSKDDYYWNIIDTCKTDEKLYKMCTLYNISFFSIPKSILGDRTTWTLDDFNTIEKTLPDGFTLLLKDSSPARQLAWLVGTSYKEWIDPVSGKLNLNTEDFNKVLQFANSPDVLTTDEPYLTRHTITQFRDYTNMMQAFDEPVTFIGYPTDDNGKLKAYIDYYFSISASSSVPAGAWEVMKFLLSDEMQKEIFVNPECGFGGIPVNKDVLNWSIDQVLSEPLEGDHKLVPPEEKDSFLALLKSIDSCSRYDKEIGDIVEEDSAPYFLGQKSAEEVEVLMQSRINLVLEERKN